MPEPCGLVVTWGSNRRAATPAGSPGPLSATSIRPPPPGAALRVMATRPPAGLASTALTTSAWSAALTSAGTART